MALAPRTGRGGRVLNGYREAGTISTWEYAEEEPAIIGTHPDGSPRFGPRRGGVITITLSKKNPVFWSTDLAVELEDGNSVMTWESVEAFGDETLIAATPPITRMKPRAAVGKR